MKILKRSITKAHVDLKTGKIYGAKKNSWHWWHEKGHLEFDRDPTNSFLLLIKDYMHDLFMVGVLLAILYKPVLFIPTLFWFVYICIMFYEEIWCNYYADAHVKKQKHL